MSNETVVILRAIAHQIDDCLRRAKETIKPKVLSGEEARDYLVFDRRTYEGPEEKDGKRDVVKYWPELEPLAKLRDRVSQYMRDLEEKA